jgi:hypothetical protein
MAALNRKGNLHISLHTHTGQRAWRFFLEGFDEVLRLRLLHLAINATQATANADLFPNIYSFHAPDTLSNMELWILAGATSVYPKR